MPRSKRPKRPRAAPPGGSCDFPAIEFPPHRAFEALHSFYLLTEPDLISAIMRRDTSEARRLINHILVHIYSLGEERGDFLKFLLLELLVVLTRRAIEAGGDDALLLREALSGFRSLVVADEDELLARWLREHIERIFSAFPTESSPPLPVERALAHIRAHCAESLSRGAVAVAAGASASHLNELLKRHLGKSFRDVVREARVAKACDMLAAPRWSLAEIASACGFCDQSHLTREFRRARGVTPRQYRLAQNAAK